MLTRFHKILIGLLVVQIALVLITHLRGGDDAVLQDRLLLAGFDAGTVTRVQIFGGTSAVATDLVKRGDSWVLASSHDYPADPAKVTELLTPIVQMAAADPIATQSSRFKQLRVGDTEFERKVVITAGAKDTTLYIGNPAGARRTAVRFGGDTRVFGVIGVTSGAAAIEAKHWVEPTYLAIPRDDVGRLTIQRGPATLELARGATGWELVAGGQPVALGAGESLDTELIDRIVGAASTLSVYAPADPKRDASAPTATITIERKSTGSTTPAPTIVDLILDNDTYWARERSRDRAVLVGKASIDEAVTITRDKLIKKPPPATSGTGSGAAPAPAGPG